MGVFPSLSRAVDTATGSQPPQPGTVPRKTLTSLGTPALVCPSCRPLSWLLNDRSVCSQQWGLTSSVTFLRAAGNSKLGPALPKEPSPRTSLKEKGSPYSLFPLPSIRPPTNSHYAGLVCPAQPGPVDQQDEHTGPGLIRSEHQDHPSKEPAGDWGSEESPPGDDT